MNKLVNKFILVVEDNAINQELISCILEDYEIKYHTCNNGLEAINYLKEHHSNSKPDLILMDCHMPVMDGYETARMIRSGKANDYFIKIPIIALTANAMQGDKEKCIDAGMDDYVTKPIDNEILESKLIKMIKP